MSALDDRVAAKHASLREIHRVLSPRDTARVLVYSRGRWGA